MKGCYVYCTDPALAARIRSRLVTRNEEPQPMAEVLPFRKMNREEALQSRRAVRLVDLKFAAGRFDDSRNGDDADWAELPDHFHVRDGMFVAQVLGESMNRQIPNGSWCLFREKPMGTRQGKVIVARHHAIDDPDLGGSYTIKRYFSEKRQDGDDGWAHQRIELRPDSNRPDYRPIVIERAEEDEFIIVAEFLGVLG